MIRTGDILRNPVTGEQLHFLKAAADTNGEYVLVEVTVEPNGFVPAAHLHPYQTETFEIVSGPVHFENRRQGAPRRRGRDGRGRARNRAQVLECRARSLRYSARRSAPRSASSD